MYQKWPNKIFLTANFVFSHDGHFGLEWGGGGQEAGVHPLLLLGTAILILPCLTIVLHRKTHFQLCTGACPYGQPSPPSPASPPLHAPAAAAGGLAPGAAAAAGGMRRVCVLMRL